MRGKKWTMWAMLAVLTLSTGCCHFYDRWCGQRTAALAPAAPACCVPCCPTTSGSFSAPPPVPPSGNAGWNQPGSGGVPCTCFPNR